MTDRVRAAALAGALITVGCIGAALGSFALLSIALCPPVTPDTLGRGCVPASLVPWYGLVLTAFIAAAGMAVAAAGFILYRRAKFESDHAPGARQR